MRAEAEHGIARQLAKDVDATLTVRPDAGRRERRVQFRARQRASAVNLGGGHFAGSAENGVIDFELAVAAGRSLLYSRTAQCEHGADQLR
jgi:hypothetical protein